MPGWREKRRPWPPRRQRAGSSTGAGATRTSSPPTRRWRPPRRDRGAPRVRRRRGRAPRPLEDLGLREPRLEPPSALEDICRADTYERASHALGKSYRDVVRGLPRRVRAPARRGRPPARRRGAGAGARLVRARRAPRRFPSAAAPASSAGWSRAASGPRSPSTCARWTACSRWTRSRGRPHPGRAHRPAAGGAAARARPDAAPLPPVVRVLHARRLGRHPRGRALRHRAHAHRRPRRVGARPHAAGLVGEPPAAGLRRGAEPRPHADRVRGHPRGDHRGLGARAARPGFRASAGVGFAVFADGAEAVRALAQSGLARPTAACSIPGRPR